MYLGGCAKTKSSGCLGTCSFLSSLKGKGRGGMTTMGKESQLWELVGLGEGQFVAYSRVGLVPVGIQDSSSPYIGNCWWEMAHTVLK